MLTQNSTTSRCCSLAVLHAARAGLTRPLVCDRRTDLDLSTLLLPDFDEFEHRFATYFSEEGPVSCVQLSHGWQGQTGTSMT